MMHKFRSTVYLIIAILSIILPVLHGCNGDSQKKKAAHEQKGDAYLADEKYAEAIIEFRNVLQLDSKDPRTYYKLGLAYLKKGGLENLQASFRALDRSLQLDPSNMDAQLKLGEFYLLDRKFERAQEKAELVLNSNPDHVEAHILLGNALAGQKELDNAIAELQIARHEPKIFSTRNTDNGPAIVIVESYHEIVEA